MQELSTKKKPGRFSTFFISTRGQLFATCCALSALICIIIGFLLSDYTRLAWPFVLASPFLAGLGMISKSRRNFAQVVLILWVIQANPLIEAAFNLGDLASLQSQLQQQTVRIENQFHKLQEQEGVLEAQLPLLQKQSNDSNDITQKDSFYEAIQATETELPNVREWVNGSYVIAEYNTFLLEENARNLPTGSSLKDTKDEVVFDPMAIQIYQGTIGDASQAITNNNAVLSQAVIPQVPAVEQTGCVSGFVCVPQRSWQQPFVDGWQALSRTPLSITWPFWLSLLLALAGMVLLLPRSLGKRWIVTYRVRYTGPLSDLNDPVFPAQKRQEFSGETAIVKIEVRSQLAPILQARWINQQREFLRFNLGSGTAIRDAFLKQTASEAASEVHYDTEQGDIVVTIQPLAPLKFARNTPAKTRRAVMKSRNRFPIVFYVVVDYFAGELAVTTPIAEIERLQEQRGPTYLLRMVDIFRELTWWIYALGLYMALMSCSFMFFRGAPYTYPPNFIPFGLGGLGATIILGIARALITRAITRQQKLTQALLPAA